MVVVSIHPRQSRARVLELEKEVKRYNFVINTLMRRLSEAERELGRGGVALRVVPSKKGEPAKKPANGKPRQSLEEGNLVVKK